jgi:hypothetical protein
VAIFETSPTEAKWTQLFSAQQPLLHEHSLTAYVGLPLLLLLFSILYQNNIIAFYAWKTPVNPVLPFLDANICFFLGGNLF